VPKGKKKAKTFKLVDSVIVRGKKVKCKSENINVVLGCTYNFMHNYIDLVQNKTLEDIRRTWWDIYYQLVQMGILTLIKRDDRTVDPFGIEIWKPCLYHDVIDHSIGMCLGLHYDMELECFD